MSATDDKQEETATILRSSPLLFDVDCNLLHADLTTLQSGRNEDDNDNDVFPILQEDAVASSNIIAMVSPSSTLAEARRHLELLTTYYFDQQKKCKEEEDDQLQLQIRTTVGIHPYHAAECYNEYHHHDDDCSALKQEIQSIIDDEATAARDLSSIYCCAIGECGLDASDGFPPLEQQIPIFQAQVDVARTLQLPLFVHERLAFDECRDILERPTTTTTTTTTSNSIIAPSSIIIHCFTGTQAECEYYVSKGYSLSVSGYICKDSSDNDGPAVVRQCLVDGIIPLDKLMIETDAPYMGFTGCRQHYVSANEEYVSTLNSKKKKRLINSIYPNVPSSLPLVLDKVLECLNKGRGQRNEPLLTREQVATQTTKNAIKFFGFKDRET